MEDKHPKILLHCAPEQLARGLASMDYRALWILLGHLSDYLREDSIADLRRGRMNLSMALHSTSSFILSARGCVFEAMQACPKSDDNPAGFLPKKTESTQEGSR